jgi:hypothetical protein
MATRKKMASKKGQELHIAHIGVFSTARTLGVLYAFLGLMVALFMIPFMFLSPFGIGMGIAMIIFAPVLYGLMGFVAGGLMALFYNVLAERLGGIRMRVTLE